MKTFLEILLPSIGGVIALLGSLSVIGRGIFRLTEATKENTKAVDGLTVKFETVQKELNDHAVQLAILADRIKR